MPIARPAKQPRPIPERRRTLVIGADCKYPDYSFNEQAVWRKFFLGQERLFPGRAADEFLAGLQELEITAEAIPSLATLSKIIERKTGWRIASSPAALRRHELFGCFAERIFPCVERPPKSLNPGTTTAFRTLLGQVPLLTNPHYAEFLYDVGRAASNCVDFELELALSRIYQATACRGLLLNSDGLRAFGCDLLASRASLIRCLTPKTRKWPFLPDVAAVSEYGEDQDMLFVLHSLAELKSEFFFWAKRNRLI